MRHLFCLALMDGGHCGSSLFSSEINCAGDEARQTPLSQEEEEIHYSPDLPFLLGLIISSSPSLWGRVEMAGIGAVYPSTPPAPPTFADGPIKNERHLLLKKIGAKPLENKRDKESRGNRWTAREWCVYTLTLVSLMRNWQTGFRPSNSLFWKSFYWQ